MAVWSFKFWNAFPSSPFQDRIGSILNHSFLIVYIYFSLVEPDSSARRFG